MTALEAPRIVYGSPTPRVATPRPPGPSEGPVASLWARDVLGVDLLPWQAWVLDNGLIRNGDRWALRTVAVMVGRQNGKTRLVTVRALAGMVLFGERDVLAAAQNRDVALDAWRDALDLAEDAGLPVHGICRTNGREQFFIGQARYKVVSSTRRGGRGLSADLVILDELREYRDWNGWAALEKTRRARRSSQVWAISNEGDDGSVVLVSLAERGRMVAESRMSTDSAWFEWSADPESNRSDVAAWAAANPALGHLIDVATIESEARTDDPVVFETEVLCRRVASLRPWIAPDLWDGCADATSFVPDGAPVVFAVDAGPELRHATIAVAHRRDDGTVHVESVAGFLPLDGPVLGRAADLLAELADRWSPAGVYVVTRSGSEAAARRALEGSDVPVVSVSISDLQRAANAFLESVVGRTTVHPGDPMTSAHLAAVSADGVLRRRTAGSDIDAAVALVLARYGATAGTSRTPAQDWLAF